jgi:predicted nucleic acid-binding protein
MSSPPPLDRVVFDAEPLVALFTDEPGSNTVEVYIEAVESTADGFISAIDLAELHAIVRSMSSKERANAIMDILQDTGIQRVDTENIWPGAAEYKCRYSIPMDDAFALATARYVDGTLLVEDDSRFSHIDAVSVANYRS